MLVVIGKYVLPFLNKALEERQEQIRASLEAADAGAHRGGGDARPAPGDPRRGPAAGAATIVTQANKTAERMHAEAEERGQQEYERMVARAEAEIVARPSAGRRRGERAGGRRWSSRSPGR